MSGMVRRLALAACAALAVSGTAAAAQAKSTLVLPGGNGEIMAMTLPDGWVRGWSGGEDATAVVQWHKADPAAAGDGSITVTRITGMGGSDPADFIRQSIEALKPECEDIIQGQVRADKATGTVRTAIGCTKRQSDGQGEMQLLHIAAGHEAIYVARRIWQVPPYDKAHIPFPPEMIATGGADIDDLKVCTLSGTGTPCPAGLAAALKDKITDLTPLELKGDLQLTP